MIQQNKIYRYSGNHYEMGYQQGEDIGEYAEEAFEIFKSLEEINGLKPKLLPKNTFIKIASKKAYNWLKPIFTKFDLYTYLGKKIEFFTEKILIFEIQF